MNKRCIRQHGRFCRLLYKTLNLKHGATYIRYAFIFALCSVVSSALSPPFKCKGSEDICNVHDVDQYCGPSPGGYKRCIPCSYKLQSCGQSDMPLECYNYCIEKAVQIAIQMEKDMPCPPLTDVHHGQFKTSLHPNQSIGTVVQITCSVGYRLEGSPSTVCMEYGKWRTPLPVCKEITCPEPAKLINGYTITDTKRNADGVFLFKSVIQFGCNTTYLLQGDTSWECQNQGTWNMSTFPLCTQDEDSTMTISIAFWCVLCGALFVIGYLVYSSRSHCHNDNTCAYNPLIQKRQANDCAVNVTTDKSHELQNLQTVKETEAVEPSPKESSPLLSAIPVPPRPLEPSAPNDDSSGETLPSNKIAMNVTPVSGIVKRVTSVVPDKATNETTDEVVTPSSSSTSISEPDFEHIPRGTTVIKAKNFIYQNNVENSTISGNIGNCMDRKVRPIKTRRDSNNFGKNDTDCSYSTEESGVTKFAEQPE